MQRNRRRHRRRHFTSFFDIASLGIKPYSLVVVVFPGVFVFVIVWTVIYSFFFFNCFSRMLNRMPHVENTHSVLRGNSDSHQAPVRGVFVGDLSSFCSEKDLYELFVRFGRISAIEIKRGRHGDSLLHGFVEYDSEQAAYAAIQAMNGFKHRGRRMR